MGSIKQQLTLWTLIKKAFFLTLGALIAAFSIECFLVPNQIIDGGIVGVPQIDLVCKNNKFI